MALPSQGYRELGLICDGPREMRGSNILVHSVCLPTDETDRGVDQQDGKGHSLSPECEEGDAGRQELLRMRLPTRSDMICGYACLRGIVNSRAVQTIALLWTCTLSCTSLMGEGTKYLGQLVWESHDHHTVVTFVLVVGTAAMRNTKRGSWYIEALTQIFSERACDMHVADMLVKVSRSVWLGTFCPSRVLSLPPPLPSHRSSLSTLPVKTPDSQTLDPWFLPFQVNGLIKEREGYAPGTEFHRCKYTLYSYCP